MGYVNPDIAAQMEKEAENKEQKEYAKIGVYHHSWNKEFDKYKGFMPVNKAEDDVVMKFNEKVVFDSKRPCVIYPLITNGKEVLDLNEASKEVVLGEFREAPSQQFLIEEQGHSVRIRSAVNGKYVSIMKDDPAEGVSLTFGEKGSAES